MNRFFVILLALGLVAIGVAGAYAYFVYIPEKVEKTVISGINRFGFENPTFSSLKREKGQIILSDVALDAEHFSTIKELRINFSLLKFLINPRQAQDITVQGLNLTGELSEDLVPFIAGWAENAKIVQSLQNFPARKITVDSATLDLLSDKFGGIKIRSNGQITIHSDGQVSIKARATTKQKKLGFISKLEASITHDKGMSFEAELDDFLIDLPHINMKRGHGTVKGIYPYDNETSALSLSGKVQFASLRWYDLPLSDIQTEIDYTHSKQRYILEGSTFGPEQIAWRTDVTHTSNTSDEAGLYHSIIHVSPKALNDVQVFLGRNKKLGVNAYLPKALLNIASPSITIENLYDTPKKIVKGTLEIKYKNPTALLKAEYKNDSKVLTDIIGSIKMDKTTFRPSSEAKDGTRFDLSALSNFTLKDYTKSPAFLWVAHTTIHNGILDFGPVEIQNVRGVVFLGGSEEEQKKKTHTLNFSFPLKKEIKHKGTLLLNFNDANKPLLEHLNLKIYGGEIKTQHPITKNGELLRKNTLDVSNINLKNLTHDAQLDGIFVSGQLAGIIPYEAKENAIRVTGGLLQNQDTGVIRISKKITEGLFPGNTPKNIALRKALENFHYEFFEIRLDGDLNDRIMMTLNTRGKNPDIKSKKPIDVNLQIETQISLLFKALMQPE